MEFPLTRHRQWPERTETSTIISTPIHDSKNIPKLSMPHTSNFDRRQIHQTAPGSLAPQTCAVLAALQRMNRRSVGTAPLDRQEGQCST